MSEARTIPWETIADWYAKNEQAIRDVMKFEGLRGAVNEVLRLAPDQPELAALREELETTIQSAWEAAGGNPGIKATLDELLSALRLMDEADDEHEATRQRLAAAEQRNATAIELLQMVKDNGGAMEEHEWERIHAALNKPEEAKS